MVGIEHSHLSVRLSECAIFVVRYPAVRGKGYCSHQWQCRHVGRCWSFRVLELGSKSKDLVKQSGAQRVEEKGAMGPHACRKDFGSNVSILIAHLLSVDSACARRLPGQQPEIPG